MTNNGIENSIELEYHSPIPIAMAFSKGSPTSFSRVIFCRINLTRQFVVTCFAKSCHKNCLLKHHQPRSIYVRTIKELEEEAKFSKHYRVNWRHVVRYCPRKIFVKGRIIKSNYLRHYLIPLNESYRFNLNRKRRIDARKIIDLANNLLKRRKLQNKAV